MSITEQTLHTFTNQWQVYSKVVDLNYLFHREAGSALQAELQTLDRPFRFLDLACGDARQTVAALRGTRVSKYQGIDLSDTALALARQNLGQLPCPAELQQSDFVAAMNGVHEPWDIVWIGLSLHHLQTDAKEQFMRTVRAALHCHGRFMIYEPVYLEGETREEFLDRQEQIHQAAWTELSPEEWEIVMTHVRSSDFPEAPSTWARMGQAAGFSTMSELATAPNGLFRVFCFRP